MPKSLIEDSENVIPVWCGIWTISAEHEWWETSRLDHNRDNSLNGTWLRILPISSKNGKLISKPALYSSEFLVFNYVDYVEINLQEQYRVFISQNEVSHSLFVLSIHCLHSFRRLICVGSPSITSVKFCCSEWARQMGPTRGCNLISGGIGREGDSLPGYKPPQCCWR